ncbi:MAG: hypothetical protein N2487_02515 [Verrucomicrobiae bacterium]|nr:hypothetical protein [Verrucomicrobiae bacterium]
MKKTIFVGTTLLVTSAFLAIGAAIDEVKSAVKNLADKPNYSWTSTTQTATGQGRAGGPTEGKTEKDGFTYLKMTRGDQTTEAVLKGEKVVVKTQEGAWQEPPQPGAGGGQGGRGAFMGRMLRNFKAPAAQADELIKAAKEIKKEGDVYTCELTEQGARQFLMFGGRGGANQPEASNAKGSAKFWIKDGLLTKYEYRVQGTVTFNNNDVNIDRTTTVEVKDVGTTKLDIPAEAKQKLQ